MPKKEITFNELVEATKKFTSNGAFQVYVSVRYDITKNTARAFYNVIKYGDMSLAKEMWKDYQNELAELKQLLEEKEQYEQVRFEERQEEERAVKQMRQEIHEIHGILTDWYRHYLSRQ